MPPVISVITATFNRAALLLRAWESLEKQIFQDFEWIVVDDGSTDNSFEILQKNAFYSQKITYIWHTNQKQPLSLNVGLKLAKGKYIAILDSDDEYLPHHLSSRFEILEKNPHLDLLEGGLEIIGNPYVPDKYDISKQIHINSCVAGGTFFGKKEVFISLNGYQNIPFASDSDFFVRACQAGFHTMKVKIPSYRYYRNTPDSQCNMLLR